jgi:hypothetical protein
VKSGSIAAEAAPDAGDEEEATTSVEKGEADKPDHAPTELLDAVLAAGRKGLSIATLQGAGRNERRAIVGDHARSRRALPAESQGRGQPGRHRRDLHAA